MKKVLLATEKPFAKPTVDAIKSKAEKAGYEFALLEKYESADQLISASKNCDALIVRSDKVTEQVINNSPNLKIVVRAGAGFDNLDLAACTTKNIVAMNTPGQNSNAVAELVLGFMIYMSRNCYGPGTGQELKGKKAGVHGCGNVGKLVVSACKALGMEVYAYDPMLNNDAKSKISATFVNNIADLYSVCDFVSLHIPANSETTKSINKSLFSVMPHNATVINTARKEVINEDDLFEAMNANKGLRYVSDVKPANHEQMTSFKNRYYATEQKIGAETAEANSNAGIAAIQQIINYFENGDTTFKVNK